MAFGLFHDDDTTVAAPGCCLTSSTKAAQHKHANKLEAAAMTAKQTACFAPSPGTGEKGRSVKIDAVKEDSVIFTNGRGVFIRSLDDPAKTVAYFGHSREATVARVSPSGYYVASGDITGAVRAWDLVGQEQILKHETKVISGRINDLRWDGESKRIIAVGDGKERFGHAFSFDSGSSTGEISGHSKVINAVAIRQQRPFRAVTAGDDGSLVFYHGVPFKFNKVIRTHSSFVHSLAYSHDGAHFLSASADRKIFLYDGSTGDTLSTNGWTGHEGGIFSVAFAKDGKSAASASADQTVRLWDVESGKETAKWKLSSQQVGGCYVGDRPISVSLGGDISVFDVRQSSGPSQTLYSSGDSPTLFSGSYDGRLNAFSTSGNCQPVQGAGHTNQVIAIASSGQNLAASAGMDDALRSIDVKEQSFRNNFTTTSSVPKGLAVDANGLTFVATAKDVQSVDSAGKTVNSSAVNYAPSAIVHSSAASQLAIGGEDGKIRILDLSLKEIAVIDKNRSSITALAYSPDGKLLAAGESSGKIIVFDTASRELKLNQWVFHTARVSSIAFSEDGQHAVTGSLDTNIYIYSVAKPARKLAIKNAHPGGVAGVCWLEGSKIASAGNDSCLRIFDVTLPS